MSPSSRAPLARAPLARVLAARVLAALFAAVLLVAVTGCSSHGSGDGPVDSSDPPGATEPMLDASVIGQVAAEFLQHRQTGGSPAAFCIANRAAAGAADFRTFEHAVARIGSKLPTDVPRQARLGYDQLRRAVEEAEDRDRFEAEMRRSQKGRDALVERYKEYADQTCGKLAPEAEALT